MHGFALSRPLIGLITHRLGPWTETHQCGQSTTSHFDLAGMGAMVKFSMERKNLNEQPLRPFLTLDRYLEVEFLTFPQCRFEAAR
jgi:hypothetical protein